MSRLGTSDITAVHKFFNSMVLSSVVPGGRMWFSPKSCIVTMNLWCSKLHLGPMKGWAFLHIAQGFCCCLVVRNGYLPTRGGSPTRRCFWGESDKVLFSWLCDVASENMDVLFGPEVSARTLVDDGLRGATVFEGRPR